MDPSYIAIAKAALDIVPKAFAALKPVIDRLGVSKKAQTKLFAELITSPDYDVEKLSRQIEKLAKKKPDDDFNRMLMENVEKRTAAQKASAKKPAARKMAAKKPAAKKPVGKKAPAASGPHYSAAKAFKSATKPISTKKGAKKPAARKRRAN